MSGDGVSTTISKKMKVVNIKKSRSLIFRDDVWSAYIDLHYWWRVQGTLHEIYMKLLELDPPPHPFRFAHAMKQYCPPDAYVISSLVIKNYFVENIIGLLIRSSPLISAFWFDYFVVIELRTWTWIICTPSRSATIMCFLY